jgi:hypothetical protein
MTLSDNLPTLPGIWLWIAAIVVGVLGAGRLTRLVVHDSYPPAVAVREWWVRRWVRTDGSVSDWSKLTTCHWCFGPWAFALVLLSAWLTDLHWGWWLFWGWLAGSYLTSIVVERDQKD